jgi:hypothetical protein
MTLIGRAMCEQAVPKQLTQKVAAMQQLSDGRFTPVWAQARISTNTSSAGNGRT